MYHDKLFLVGNRYTAMPDASNILQLSKLFGVTTDYLLNDDYQSDNDLPKVKEVQNDNLGQTMIYLVTLEVMVLLMQFMTTVILQNVFFGFLSFIPFVAAIGVLSYDTDAFCRTCRNVVLLQGVQGLDNTFRQHPMYRFHQFLQRLIS